MDNGKSPFTDIAHPQADREAISVELSEVVGIVAKMHSAWIEHERLNEQSAEHGMFEHIEAMSDQLDIIRDAVPGLNAALNKAIASAPLSPAPDGDYVLVEVLDRLTRVASGFPDHNDRDGIGWVRVRYDDLNAILAARPSTPTPEEKSNDLASDIGDVPQLDGAGTGSVAKYAFPAGLIPLVIAELERDETLATDDIAKVFRALKRIAATPTPDNIGALREEKSHG